MILKHKRQTFHGVKKSHTTVAKQVPYVVLISIETALHASQEVTGAHKQQPWPLHLLFDYLCYLHLPQSII